MKKAWPWLLVAAGVIISKMSKKDEKAPAPAPAPGTTTSGARGIRNNNPGNLSKGSKKIWNGEVWPSTDPRFAQFMTMAYGVRALLIDLTNKHKSGLRTPRAIIFKYAPPTENYSTVYANFVADALGIPATQSFNMTKSNLIKFAKAVARFENGPAAALINAQAWEEGERRALARTDIADYLNKQK